MKVIIGDYMAKPYSSGLCWQIFKKVVSKNGNKREGVGPGEEYWMSLDHYPTTLLGCIEMISNFLLMDGQSECGIDSIVSEVGRIMDEVRLACAEIDPKSMAELERRKGSETES